MINKQKINDYLKYIYVIFFFGLVAFTISGVYDFWWHLKCGLWMIENKALLKEDVFSFVAKGQYFTNTYIFFQLPIAACYLFFKKNILSVQFFISFLYTIIGTIFILYLKNKVKTFNWHIVALSILLPLFFLHYENLRATVMSYLFISIYLYTLFDVYHEKQFTKSSIAILIISMFLWVNSHNFVMGLIIYFALFLDCVINDYKNKQISEFTKKVFIVGFLIFLTSFLTPFVTKFNFFTVFKSANSSYSLQRISEYRNGIMFLSVIKIISGRVLLVFYFLNLFCLIAYILQNKKLDFYSILLIFFSYLSLRFARFLTDYIVASFFIIPIFYKENKISKKTITIFSYILLLISPILTDKMFDYFKLINKYNKFQPFEISEYLKSKKVSGKLCGYFFYGNIIIFNNFEDKLYVGMDGRSATTYTDLQIWENEMFSYNFNRDYLMKKYNPDYLLLNPLVSKDLINSLLLENWKMAYFNYYSMLLVKDNDSLFTGIGEKNPNIVWLYNDNVFDDLIDSLRTNKNFYVSLEKRINEQKGFFTANVLLGLKAYVDKDTLQAEKIWKEAIKTQPYIDVPYYYLGSLYLNKKDYKNAKYYLLKGKSLLPRYPYSYSLAKIYIAEGKYKKAKKILFDTEPFKMDTALPIYSELYELLAEAEFNLGNYKDAYFYFSCVLELKGLNNNDPLSYYNVGVSLQGMNKHKESIEYFKKAISLDTNDIDSRIELLRSYHVLNMPDSVNIIKSEIDSLINNNNQIKERKSEYDNIISEILNK